MLNATLTVHMVPLLTDQGLSLQTASYVWATLMGVATVFQLVGGYLGDRYPKNVVFVGFSALQAGGFTLAAVVHGLPMAFLFAVAFGAGFGGRVPLTTAIRGDYFGSKAFGTITGISTMAMYRLMMAAPMFAAIMFDARGSYTFPFLVLGLLGSTSVVCFLFATKPVFAEPAWAVRAVPSHT
jgi:MFS family permease